MCSTFLLWTTATPDSSSAAPIATPTPGTATTLTAPAPDPAQFDFSAQQVLTHQSLNSDIYGPWYEFFSLIGALNATGAGAYACGPCITALTNGTGISTTLGAQSSGVGVTATIGLSHGDYADLSSAQTIGGAKTFSGSVTVNGQLTAGQPYGATNAESILFPNAVSNTTIGASSSVSVQGVTCAILCISNGSPTYWLAIDNSGSMGVAGSLTAANVLVVHGGAPSYVPPVYTPSGAAVASTLHAVFLSGSFAGTQSANCGAFSNDYCATVTLSGAAAFSAFSSSSPPPFACGGGFSQVQGTGYFAGYFSNAGSGFVAVSVSSAAPNTLYIASSVANQQYSGLCEGT